MLVRRPLVVGQRLLGRWFAVGALTVIAIALEAGKRWL